MFELCPHIEVPQDGRQHKDTELNVRDRFVRLHLRHS
jgi:hypothetical protein